MGGRPPKHLSLVSGHLTKEEKETREKGQALLTAKAKMRKSPEVRKNKAASAYFNRLQGLYTEVGVCDGLCENTINRYCLLLARQEEIAALSGRVSEAMEQLQEQRTDMEMDVAEYFQMLSEMTRQIISLERAAAKIRDQLLAIERENLLTIQGKLRAVPKKPEKEKAKSGFAAYKEKYGGPSG